MKSRWQATSELTTAALLQPSAQALIASLRRQPVLVVLRPAYPVAAAPLLARLQALGLVHVELAWQPSSGWSDQMAELIELFPRLSLGAASINESAALNAAIAAGCSYGVSPILDLELLARARSAGFTLVPGVMTPSEVHLACKAGASLVKLFPAAPLGAGYWQRLREPLALPLPFCIAAGGLGLKDVAPWLAAGVDAIALGSALQNDFEPLRMLLAGFRIGLSS